MVEKAEKDLKEKEPCQESGEDGENEDEKAEKHLKQKEQCRDSDSPQVIFACSIRAYIIFATPTLLIIHLHTSFNIYTLFPTFVNSFQQQVQSPQTADYG